MNTVFLRLEGPLQSWGTRAHWEERDTGLEPTKSGVIGLVGAALGLPRMSPDLRVLSDTLLMGVRVDRQGQRLVDYHTTGGGVYQSDLPPVKTPTHVDPYQGGVLSATSNKRGIMVKMNAATNLPETDVSYRHYLMDAAFCVALQGDPGMVERVVHGLQAPVWPLFLGRKSCIMTNPVFVGVGAYTDLFSALSDMVTCPLSERADPWLRVILEQKDATGLRRHDAVGVPGMRRFLPRYVREERIPHPSRATGINTMEG